MSVPDVHFETRDGLPRVRHANGAVCCPNRGCGDCGNCFMDCEVCHPVPVCGKCRTRRDEGRGPFWQCTACRGPWWCDDCFPEVVPGHDPKHMFIEN